MTAEAPRNRTKLLISVLGGVVVLVVAAVGAYALTRTSDSGGARRAAATTTTTAAPTTTTTTALPPPADPAAPARIITPDQDAPNPFMLVEGGTYYLYSTTSSLAFSSELKELPLRVSTDFVTWSPPIEALPVVPAWASAASSWAPDVRKVGSQYVMYFTAQLKDVAPETRCIGTATSPRPDVPFTPVEQVLVCQLDHRGSIDPRTFVDTDGSLWLHWKSDENADVEGTSHSSIYAQRLGPDGLSLVGDPVVIATADQPWEGRIVEAPQMVLAGGRYWLFYSGNWYNQPSYAIGVAQCNGPAGPCSKPYPGPFLSSNAQGAGPGESSLFSDKNGWWIVYGPVAVQFRTDTMRPVALAHVAFNELGPYLAAF